MDPVWGGTALPASKGGKKPVGTLIRKAAAMIPPAQEQLLAWLNKASNVNHSLYGPPLDLSPSSCPSFGDSLTAL